MNGKQLKISILQEAIQGRLVPQDPNDEPASVLLERIRAEKEKLVKEGKIKKNALRDSLIYRGEDNKYYERSGKTITCIDKEIPFEIPKSWEWVRLGTVFAHNNGKQLNKNNSKGRLMEYITTSNLYWDGFKLEGLKKMPFEEQEIERCKALKGDLLVCEGGDVGRSCIWPYDTPIMLQNHIHKLRAYYTVCTKYFFYVLYEFNLSGRMGGKGIGIQGFSSNALHNTNIPLPPLSEQHRIVSKVEEVLPFVERYEKAQEELDVLCNSLGGRLRKSILGEAIQGRLVPQDPNDEPASVLLERVRAEKAKLVKEGKIKKNALRDSLIYRGEDNKYYERSGKTITCIDKEIPFEIPKSWEWVRLGNVCQLTEGERRTGEAIYLDAEYLRGKSKGTYINAGKFVPKGDIIILVDGENSGEVFKVPIDGYMCSTFKQLRLSHITFAPYLLMFIFFNKQNLRENKKGAATPHLRKELFFNLLLPLPPLSEQHRIVAKIEELFRVIKQLPQG